MILLFYTKYIYYYNKYEKHNNVAILITYWIYKVSPYLLKIVLIFYIDSSCLYNFNNNIKYCTYIFK